MRYFVGYIYSIRILELRPMMSAFRCILTVVLLALPLIKGVACCTGTDAVCHCFLNYQHHGLDIPISYSNDWEDDPLDYPDDGQDTLGYPDPIDYLDDEMVDPLTISYPDDVEDVPFVYPSSREDDQFDYPDVWEDLNYTHRCEIRNLYEGMMSLCAFMNDSVYIMVPGSPSHGYYLDSYEEEMEEMCGTALHQHGTACGSDTSNCCRDIKWCSECCPDETEHKSMVDPDDEEIETSVNLTQNPDNIQAPSLGNTSDTPPSNTQYNTPEKNPSCCHGNETSQDDAVVRTSKSCYECQSDPWGACGDGFDPSSEEVMEVQCYDGCQKSVHPEFVSRGCLSSDHQDECMKKVCMTELCTHCCVRELCNAAIHNVHISIAAVMFNLHVLLLYTHLLLSD